MKASKAKRDVKRFAAKLLFQFRVVARGASNKRRICEERIVHFESSTARAALADAKRYGRGEQHSYKNNNGGNVFFEFVGVQDLLEIGPECGPNEVWYDIIELLKPMERRRKLVPPDSKLDAVAWADVAARSARRGGKKEAMKRAGT